MAIARHAAVILVPVAAALGLSGWPVSCHREATPPPATPAPPPLEPTPVVAAAPAPSASAAPEPQRPPSTSCREVVHVGDSTSIGLVSTVFLPNVDDRIAARYHAVGVERFLPEISGARSMVETYKDEPNATQIVKRGRAKGYKGCYVFALGTNDPANTSGNVAALGARIDAMMAQIGDRPALWTTTKTLKDKGPYQNAHMAGWNEALLGACARHANMRVYDWAGEVHDEWFMRDGIHYNSAGYRERAARIAKALARAFPKEGAPTPDCVVHVTE